MAFEYSLTPFCFLSALISYTMHLTEVAALTNFQIVLPSAKQNTGMFWDIFPMYW
jgi:hypothetical protein